MSNEPLPSASFCNTGRLDAAALTFTVWPNNPDPFRHMNNGRYLTIMDLGRLDYLIKTGLVGRMHRLGWELALGAAEMRYMRPLLPFQRYELKTKVVCWDDKWFYKEQRFVRGGSTVAAGHVKVLLRGKNGNVPTRDVLDAVGARKKSPEPPEQVKLWQEMEKKR
ncbi:MAG: acyl-CoA thioesterase [Nitrospinota bacterium]